jgi:CheY-like chemotaxis protein/anti-sigma regulatory factor (Ser/Thr protein kinase)
MPGEPATILLVEDEANVLKMLERFLAPSYRCVSATNGKDALEVLKSERDIDILVTDVRMPLMDGIQLIRAVRRMRPYMPAIAMTAYGSEETAVEALRAGATNYLRKPFKTQEFLAVVRKCIELAQARRGKTASLSFLKEATKTFEVPARLENARALLPHLTEGLSDLGIVEAQDLLNLDVALEEALSNAVIHGSLQLTDEYVKNRQDREAFEKAYAARRTDPKFAAKTISVTTRLSPSEVVFIVEDKGPGFDPSALPEVQTSIQGVQGRGLMLIRLFMDEAVHENGGRRLRMVKRAPKSAP